MIRRIETITDADLETIASIWLRSNLESHAFIGSKIIKQLRRPSLPLIFMPTIITRKSSAFLA